MRERAGAVPLRIIVLAIIRGAVGGEGGGGATVDATTIVQEELLVEDADEDVGPKVQARACARTEAPQLANSISTTI